MKTKVTKEKVQEWYNAYKKGMTMKEIHETFNVSTTTISKYFKFYNFKVDWNSYHVKLDTKTINIFKEAKEHYIEGNSLNSTVKYFKIETKINSFRNYLKQCGIRIRSLSESGSIVSDHNFFSKIDSEEKAYLLGFFAADGHIEKRKDYDSYTFRINVNMKDASILMLANKLLTNNRAAISVSKTRNIASIAVTSKQIGEDLLKLGFDSNKTHSWRSLPNINKNLMNHFIRGYFDGDGSIMLNRRKQGNRLGGFNRKFNLVSSNDSVLKEIECLLGIKFNYKYRDKSTKEVNGNIAYFKESVTVDVFNLKDLNIIHNYLYSNASYYFLRKKKIFDLAILEDKKLNASLQGNL